MLVALTFLALLAKVIVPPGYMLAESGPTMIVICTGNGPMMMAMDHHGEPDEAPKSKADHPCAFAGHGAPPLIPPIESLRVPFEIAATVKGARPHDVSPGQGLAAPPPPSRAPPRILA